MLKKANFAQVVVFIVSFCSFSWALPVPPQEESQMLSSLWKLPSQFTLKRLESLLNRVSQDTYGKAFRYLGVEEDFFHGHVLFERRDSGGQSALHPRAILYHTQEEAHKAHWEKAIDEKYDYLNVTTRNWIQWLSDEPSEDGVKIENGRNYLDETQKDPSPFFQEGAKPQKELHYTIHAKNLDPQKLGFVLAGELQFEFYRENQNSPDGETRKILIQLPEEAVSLQLVTNTMYITREATPSQQSD